MTLKIGLIGCGNISDIYLTNADLFRDFGFVACADLKAEAAAAQAARYGIEARSVEALLASEDVDIILNLTIPDAHAEVSLAALSAGKHVYGEKPLATKPSDGRAILDLAAAKGLRVGSAPDTFLGAGIQTSRRLIDEGRIGKPLLGVAAVLSHGMEHWHPNPDFFFKPGGGPVFDMGPYYIAALVSLLGPVRTIAASGQIGFETRTISSPTSTRRGEAIRVETLTTVQALLGFESGAQITFLASWDVWRHDMPLELHGTAGSLRVPDPNFFGGTIELAEERGDWAAIVTDDQFLGRINWPAAEPRLANYRGLGLADMARAITDGRPHRASGEIALHTLDVMAGILEAATEERTVTLSDGCERPAALDPAEADGLLVAVPALA